MNINTGYIIYLSVLFGTTALFSYLLKRFMIIFKIFPLVFLLYIFAFIENTNDAYSILAVVFGIVFVFRENLKQLFYFLRYKFSQIKYYISNIFIKIFSALKIIYIQIFNCFTWLYNFLAKIIKINRRFYYFHEEVPKDKKQRSYKKKYNNFQQQPKKEKIFVRDPIQEEELRKAKEELKQAREETKQREEELKQQQNSSNPPPDNRAPREILEVFSNPLTRADLKTAYRIASNKCHPDKVQHLSKALQDIATQEFIKVNEAYEKLLNIAV